MKAGTEPDRAADEVPASHLPTESRPPRSLHDGSAVLMAVVAGAGAWLALPVGRGVGAVVVALALILRRPMLLILGVGLLASGLAAHATAGLVVRAGHWSGTVEVLDVGTRADGEVHAEVRADDHHLDLVPPGPTRSDLTGAHPGDRFVVSGQVTATDPADAVGRGSHVAGRIRATRVEAGPPPRQPWRLAGSIRRWITGLGAPLSEDHQALFSGFVLGDATGQTPEQRADFRAAGLTHLLVASGANVAFVLYLAAPVLGRTGSRTRWVLTVGLCGLYALVTGLEPSVLRAAAMVVVAASAAGIGRPARSWRTLAYAVTVLVLADPFLVHSAAFGLSVGASAGILALARPLARVLPGPAWLRRALAATVAAQLGVAPLLLGFPGGLPVATLPANVLAAVPAGLVMVAGVPALVVAATGIPGTGVCVWIPRLLLGWVDAVARGTASLALGHLGATAVLVATIGVTFVVIAGRGRLRWLRRAGAVLAVGAFASPLIWGVAAPPDGDAASVTLRRGDTVVVVLTGQVPAEQLLTELSVARVRRIDLVVVPHGDAADAAMLDTIAHRHRIGGVLTPARLPGTRQAQIVVTGAGRVHLGDAEIWVLATRPDLRVHVPPDATWRRAGSDAAPVSGGR